MSGMEEGLKDLNYKVISRKLKIPLSECLSVEYVENKIKTHKGTLLRWFIIDLNNQQVTIYATLYFENED